MKVLTEITHLEDLGIQDFIKTIQNLPKLKASEKLDGSNIIVGLDDAGKLYTTRANKAKKYYNEADYPLHSANNGFRGALAALKSKEDIVNSILEPGDAIELEVLFGRQPNATTYGKDGKNYIAFLRDLNSTSDEKVNALADKLKGEEINVNISSVETTDGENLTKADIQAPFKFVGVQQIDPELLSGIDVSKALGELEAFLKEPSGVEDLSNFELLTGSLASIPVASRQAAKEAKEKLKAKVLSDFKLPIKKELLDKFVSKVKPQLAASDMSPDEDLGIEGVVLRDPETNELIKLVDKDGFTAINQFNYAIRNQLSGQIQSTNDDASLEAKGGLVGLMKIRIAQQLGDKNLATARGLKKLFAANKGNTAAETVQNSAKALNVHDYIAFKKKTIAIIENTLEQVKSALSQFKELKSGDTYKLKLKSGKTIGLSPEIAKRTLLVFAEVRRNLIELLTKVKAASNLPQLLAILYGGVAKKLHETEPEEVTESLHIISSDPKLLQEKRNYTDKARYSSVQDAWSLLNIYLATLMMTVLMYKADDKQGRRLVKDKPHYRLTKWTPEMSAFNFWGYPVWRASQPAVKKLIGNKTAAEIFKITRRVPPAWVKFLHMDLSFGKDVPIDWNDHKKTIKVLLQFPGLATDRVNSLLQSTFDYDQLSHDERVKYLAKLYMFAMQFVPTSPLLTRVRAIQDLVLMDPDPDSDSMPVANSLLQAVALSEEEGDNGLPSGTQVNVTQTSSAVTSADIANLKTPIGNHQIVKRKRNPALKVKRFARPKKEDK